MIDRSASSSPDPISLIQHSSPARPGRPPTRSSPSKSIFVDTEAVPGQSPIRVKVTLQAQPITNINRKVMGQSNANGALVSPRTAPTPIQRRGRLRKSQATQIPIDAAEVREVTRRATPARAPHGRHTVPSDHDITMLDGSYRQAEDNSDVEPLIAPGDLTTYESEGFSMISVDSLASHNTGSAKRAGQSISVPHKTDMSISYMPSSPPFAARAFVTPNLEQQTLIPPAPAQQSVTHSMIMTPLRESAKRSGRVLQDIVRDPNVSHLPRRSQVTPTLFDGFSPDTKRKLRQSLRVGLQLGHESNNAAKQPSVLSPVTYPDLSMCDVNHRLPTPDDKDQDVQAKRQQHSSARNDERSISAARIPSSIARRTYDDMSWIATSKQAADAAIASTSPLRHVAAPGNSEQDPIEVSSRTSKSDDEESEPIDSVEPEPEETGSDIWQEEADRSAEVIHNEEAKDEVSAMFDRPLVPRRSKIPRTWRRTSGNDFHYSDSPEPESLQERQTSSASSSRQSTGGVITPPTTDDDETSHCSQEQVELHQNTEGNSEEDTGMFWHTKTSKMVQTRREGDRKEFSMVSELKPISSPTRIEASTMSEQQSHSGRRNATRLMNSSPRRKERAVEPGAHSNLNIPVSRADRSTPATSSLTDPDNKIGSDDNEELPGDKERSSLHNSKSHCEEAETSTHSQQNRGPSADDASYLEDTYLSASRSYEEHLNLSSPMKIKVKFNDSSVMGSSSLHTARGQSSTLVKPDLSPRKRYHSLFEEDAPLGGTAMCEEAQLSPPVVEERKAGGLLSRIASSFWTTTTAKVPEKLCDATEATVQAHMTLTSSVQSSVNSSPATRTADDGTPRLVQQAAPPTAIRTTRGDETTSQLRRKYGLLSAQHPFTLQHIRTLHRLHNSTKQHASGTIVSRTSTAVELADRHLGERYHAASTGTHHTWSRTDLHVVTGFMALLVPDEEKERLEAEGAWGDDGAERTRGWDSKGRHGSWFAFAGEGSADKTARALRGDIEVHWVLEVLGEIICKEAAMARERAVV